jgi:5-methylcytosine-specific restriction endonuclease McrA
MRLLRAAPYEFRGRAQPGKMHAIREGERTFCGEEYRYLGGEILEGDRSEVTCKRCVRSMDAQDSYQESREKWQAIAAERAAEQEQQDREWWAWYSAYLKTPAWAKRRQLVFDRANGLCEGCRSAAPVHAHHTTYAHVGDELLYELVALCPACHQKAHPDKDIDDGWRPSDS